MIVELRFKVAIGKNGAVRFAGRRLGRVYRDDVLPPGERWCIAPNDVQREDAAVFQQYRTQRAALVALLKHCGVGGFKP